MPRLVSFKGLIQNVWWASPPLSNGSLPWGLYMNIHRLHLEQAFETLLEEMMLDPDVFDETFSLQLELVFFTVYSCLHKYNHAVLCYSCISL